MQSLHDRNRNEISEQPDEKALEYFHTLQEQYPCRLSGQSLKFIRSQTPVCVFEVEPNAFRMLRESLETGSTPGSLGMGRLFGDAEIRFIRRMDGKEFHFLLRREGHAPSLQISTDRLHYEEGQWLGDEQAEEDLKNQTLRLDHPPEPRSDDCLRLCVLCSMLNFSPDPATVKSIAAGFQREEARLLPRRMLQKQFRRLVCGARPSRGFLALRDAGLLDWFLPELARGQGLNQNRHHKYDIFYHSIYSCDAVEGPNLPLRLAALFHDLGKVDTRKEISGGEATFHNHELVSTRHTERILRRFAFNGELIKNVRFLVRHHMFHYTAEWTDRAVRRFMKRVEEDRWRDLLLLRLADRQGSGKRARLPAALQDMIEHMERIREQDSELTVRDLAINGHTLQEMGMKPGVEMGRLLRELLARVKAGELPNEPDALKEEVLSLRQQTAENNLFTGCRDGSARTSHVRSQKSDSPRPKASSALPREPSLQ